jgi:hypothetical protein
MDRLLRRGFLVRGLAPPSAGRYMLRLRARGQVIAIGRSGAVSRGKRLALRARLTKPGRRLLKEPRRLRVAGTLSFLSRPAQRSWSATTRTLLRR